MKKVIEKVQDFLDNVYLAYHNKPENRLHDFYLEFKNLSIKVRFQMHKDDSIDLLAMSVKTFSEYDQEYVNYWTSENEGKKIDEETMYDEAAQLISCLEFLSDKA